jgi:hypothetical protein
MSEEQVRIGDMQRFIILRRELPGEPVQLKVQQHRRAIQTDHISGT